MQIFFIEISPEDAMREIHVFCCMDHSEHFLADYAL